MRCSLQPSGPKKPIPWVGALTRSAALLVLSVLGACSGAQQPDLRVRDTAIVVNSTAAFTQHPDFAARVESTVDAALAYWGGNWSQLAGRTITFEGERQFRCGDTAGAVGCFDGDIRVTTQDIGFTYYCVEETALVHEIGHAVIGDPAHLDPRWMDFAAVVQHLDGRQGYAETGEVPCQIFPTVWKHPPDVRADAVASATVN